MTTSKTANSENKGIACFIGFLFCLGLMVYMLTGFYSYNDLNLIATIIALVLLIAGIWVCGMENRKLCDTGALQCITFVLFVVNPMLLLLATDGTLENLTKYPETLPKDNSHFLFTGNLTLSPYRVLMTSQRVQTYDDVWETIRTFHLVETGNDVIGDDFDKCLWFLANENVVIAMDDCKEEPVGDAVQFKGKAWGELNTAASAYPLNVVNVNGKEFAKGKFVYEKDIEKIRARLVPVASWCAGSTIIGSIILIVIA